MGGAADRAWELFRQMQGAGLEPELRTYTTLMDAWINAGHADKALQVGAKRAGKTGTTLGGCQMYV